VLLGLAVSACSLSPVQIDDVVNEISVRAAEVKIKNLADTTDKGGNEHYTSKFQPLPSDATQPAFPTLVSQSMKKSFSAEGGTETIEVNILRADISVKSRVIDSVVFIGFASALSPRDARCEVDVLIENSSDSKRLTLQSTSTIPLLWADLDVEKRRRFVQQCIAEMQNSLRTELVNL
jgi:hypothetical protein